MHSSRNPIGLVASGELNGWNKQVRRKLLPVRKYMAHSEGVI